MSDVTAGRREEYETAVAQLMANAPPAMPMALAVREGEVRNTHILFRGDPERPGPRQGNLLLQMLDVSQRIGAGRCA